MLRLHSTPICFIAACAGAAMRFKYGPKSGRDMAICQS